MREDGLEVVIFELSFEGQVLFSWTKMIRREFPEEGIQSMKAQRHEKATHHWEPLCLQLSVYVGRRQGVRLEGDYECGDA